MINESRYIGSFPSESKCPKDNKPEYAFIGRSNVGKSSLINMLCGRRALAHVSKKPGKTQYLNFYVINDEYYIVDLPGYGYAKTSKTKRKEWEKMIYGYLQKSINLQCTFVLIDANIPPQKLDIDFINWLGEMRIPFVIVFTKTDRQNKVKIAENIEVFQQELLKSWNELPQQFTSSAVKGVGKEEIVEFMEEVNKRVEQGLVE